MGRFFHRKHNITFLLLVFVFACILAWFVNCFIPETLLLQAVFYMLVGCVAFFLGLFIFINTRSAMLVAGGMLVYLLLRSLNLRHPLYLILLIAVLYSLSVYYNKPE